MAHADAVQSGSLWYNLDESARTAEVTTSGGDVYSGEIVIPSSFEYDGVSYTVTSIGNNAFSEASISKVTFPSSLTKICESAFWFCQNLTFLYFSDGLTTVENNAFYGCWNLEKVIVPSLSAWCSVNFGNYDSNPLYHANHLYLDENTEITELDIPQGVTTIGSHAFLKCTEVSSVTIPSSVIYIGENAFSECNNLEKVIVSDISAWCSISFGNIDSNPLNRAHHLFSDENTEITELNIPSGITTIKAYAFSNLTGLTSIVIPNSITTVGDYAFTGCHNASFESFPSSLTSIGESAFWNCNGIAKISFSSGLETIGDRAFAHCNGLQEVDFPSTLIKIGNDAFRHCPISRLELPASLTSIGEWAFAELNSLSIVISRIEDPFALSQNVFCSSYSSIWDDAENKDVYTYTKSEATLYVPDNTKSAYQAIEGWNMFADIIEGELKEITVDGLNYTYIDGKGIATVIGRANEELRNITIPGSIAVGGSNYTVKEVGVGAFRNCGIDTLIIQEGVEKISREAFRENWGNLRSVTLPKSLRTIGDNAFNSCYGIRTLIIPEGVTTIGREAFRECDYIQKLDLPSTLTSIGDYAFYPARNMSVVSSRISTPFDISEGVFCTQYNSSWDETEQKSVYTYTPSSATLYVPDGTASAYKAIDGWNMFANIVEGELKETTIDGLIFTYLDGKGIATVIGRANEELRNITIPGSITVGNTNYTVKEIGAGAFQNCNNLDTLVISSGVEIIGNNAFRECHYLKSVIIPEGVKTIGENAFQYIGNWGGQSIKKIVLPSTLSSIGEYAFAETGSISVVTSKISTPFAIERNVFCTGWDYENNNQIFRKSEATLYVPDGTRSAYLAIDGWNMFADIVEGELKETTINGLIYSYLDGKGIATVIGRADDELRNITIPGSITVGNTNYTVKEIGAGAFQNCNNLDTLVISSGVEIIGKNAFRECHYLKSVTIPEGVKTIGDNAFRYIGNWGGQSIKNIVLPSTLSSIGEYAFAETGSILVVTSKISTPFAIEKNVFCTGWSWDENDNQVFSKSEATLYVPDGTRSAYLAIDGWNMFADIIEGELKEATIGGLIYSYLNGKGATTVIGRADEEMRNIAIPGSLTIDGANYTVKEIGANAFQSCGIDTLVIGEGVETIGSRAFSWCNYIKSLVLPTSLRTIGEHAFYDLYYIKDLEIPEGVTTIGESAFQYVGNWVGDVKVVIPSTVTSIGDYAFWTNNSITSVKSKIQVPFDISENVFAVGSTWNEEQQKDEFVASNANLFIPEGTIGQYKKAKGWNMFAAIYEGEMKETVVGDLKFAYLPSTHIAMVISGDYSELEKVTIPGTVEIEGTNYQVTEIGAAAFRGCSRLDTVIIENGIEKIGNNAFQDCYNAEFGTLPSSIKTIGDWAFRWCSGFKIFEIPEGVQSIGAYSFANCNGMLKIILPSTLTSIGEGVIIDSNNLASVVSHIKDVFEVNKTAFASNWYWSDEKQETIYTPCAATLYVPEGTMAKYKAIEGWTMFREIYEGELKEAQYGDLYYTYNTSSKVATVVKGENYSELRKVSIPSTIIVDNLTCNVKTIGARAFSNTSITSVDIADGIETIVQEAFQNCSQLGSISLPSSLTSIGSGAFRDCYRLSSILIPASVNSIELSAFAGCKALASIKVAEGNTVFESRNANAVIESATNTLVIACKNTVIPTSVTAIGTEAFVNLDIEQIAIPSSVKTIGDNAFNSCHKLVEVVLPEGLETLGNTAFHSCSGLTLVELPKSLKTIGAWAFAECNSLTNVVSNIVEPKDIDYNTFGEYDNVYSQATLWVPRGKVSTYKGLEGWSRFKNFDELLYDNLTKPTISYNGRYLSMTNDTTQRAKIYYSTDGSAPTILYSDTITISNLGTIQAISKRFGSYTVDTARYEITYVYDGVTARTASGGLLKKAFEWCGTDNIEMLDIDGVLNDEDFGTVRGLPNLTTLNMASSKLTAGAIPAEAFANTKLQWYVSPYTFTSVGANIFKGCQNLTAITWNSSSVELPEDVVTDVANPNMLVYAKAQAMIPYALRNVIVNGVANSIVLVDTTGNNNFNCPEQFMARRITYSHDYLQQTSLDGETQGWETIALPFTVSKITHERQGVITPIAVEGAAKPFWLYELGDNGLQAASQIKANIPYLICMPNNDGYGDEYILGGRVTFTGSNVTITSSGGTTVSSTDRKFVPTYKRVAASADVYAMNVNQAVGENRIGSAFVANLREVRPFEAYSVHSSNRSNIISLSSIGGGDTTGIIDVMLKKNSESSNDVVKVYSLSGALIKQGKREEVLSSLPKGLYIIDGKKIIK